MVYISRVLMRNFKSFSGEIKLNFQQGFNIITGPNGSGKSNIIDAVQFVLGELGSKRMRVQDLSGLIFEGAEDDVGGKAQMAQVTLYFDNIDRVLASDRNTVSIGRRIDRGGKSDYYLNGKRTSRKVVLDLLEMAGIAPGGYNIVLQGTATRLSDLTPSERMTALEDLVGIVEYDEKKAEAKARLNEAERKIEVANARIDEIRKRVTELERQRNDALRFNHLAREERWLTAVKLSFQISDLEVKLVELNSQIKEREEEAAKLEEERNQLREEREAARNRLEEFNKEASERGNTKLPLLRSDLVGKNTLKEGMTSRLREIDSRKTYLLQAIAEKDDEVAESEKEQASRHAEIESLSKKEQELAAELNAKKAELQALTEQISVARETAGENQRQTENLTESLVPMQEALSGLEIEINTHAAATSTIGEKLRDLEGKKGDYEETAGSLMSKLDEFAALKAQEASSLEEMLRNLEEQITRQKALRGTIANASQLAKQAETTITEFSAKRDLWRHILIEEKALERIREIGEAGALTGYHGSLRNLVKIDLPNQRAAYSAAGGWINAIVVDDLNVALECVDRLKKTRLGMTRFIPLNQLKKPEPLQELKEEGVVGILSQLIRCDEAIIPVAHMIWGDTYLVKDGDAALRVNAKGYRAVTTSGDVFDPKGSITGGYYRRPPDFSKLIPTEESMDTLSKTIKNLRHRLKTRMTDLKASGGNLRGFTTYMDSSKERMSRIDAEVAETNDKIERLNRNIATADESMGKLRAELEKEQGLIASLGERKQRTLQQIEETKQEITRLREWKPSDVTELEMRRGALSHEVDELQAALSKVQNDIAVQRGFVDRILALRVEEAIEQRLQMREEVQTLAAEKLNLQQQLADISREITTIELTLVGVRGEVEATTKILDQHQKTLRMINQRFEDLDRRREAVDKRKGQLAFEAERLKLQSEQRWEELARNGYEDIVNITNIDLDRTDSMLQQIRMEKSSLGAINQLALDHYDEYMNNYKQQSTRINELEGEKASILKFMEEVEREKTAHFMAAFNEVCENFSNLFSKLTGGGDGRLELQNPEEPFSGGVDLYIQFPGKAMRLGTGASGGERSVAAIAYLLAIQRFLKAPFYLFDEIDAHLDDVNTSRLSEVLKDNALEAQFLMVSLKDVMVHNADRIYGVFSQGGRSRVLALPMKMKVEGVAQ
jgi:chromosome segregation protein